MAPQDTPKTASNETPSVLVSAAEALEAARKILPWMVEIRRDLHQHPELGLEEVRTARQVQGLLDELGIEHEDGIGGTGIVGTLRSGEPGKVVALRADMDALPLQDAKSVPYTSKIPGKMHACGHDVHTSILLGASRLLVDLMPRWAGTVKLLFQPAEETVGGAKLLIAAGALSNPPVDAVFGLHVEPDFDVGHIAVRYGQRNASSDSLKITLIGRSCHAAYPSGGVDAIAMAAQVVSALQTVISRNVDARDSAVLTLGTVRGGTQSNIVADRVELTGTVRTLDPTIRELVLRRVRETVQGIAGALGGEARIEIESGYDALINYDKAVDLVRRNAERLVGEDKVYLRPRPNMGVEDFAYYLSHAPGAFFSLGVRNEERGIVHSVHQPGFDVDEECLAYGAALQVLNTLTVLMSPGPP